VVGDNLRKIRKERGQNERKKERKGKRSVIKKNLLN
jgi:hypothetical protein